MNKIFDYKGYEVYLNNETFYITSFLGELVCSFIIYKGGLQRFVVGSAYYYSMQSVYDSIIEICKRRF